MRGRCPRPDARAPLGNRPWRRGDLFSGSSHERSFLKRTDQEPPHLSSRRARWSTGRHGQESHLHASAGPRSRACRGGVQDWPIIPVGIEGATIAPPEVATATRSEPRGHSRPGTHRIHPWSRSGLGPGVADRRHDRLGTFTADPRMTQERNDQFEPEKGRRCLPGKGSVVIRTSHGVAWVP